MALACVPPPHASGDGSQATGQFMELTMDSYS